MYSNDVKKSIYYLSKINAWRDVSSVLNQYDVSLFELNNNKNKTLYEYLISKQDLKKTKEVLFTTNTDLYGIIEKKAINEVGFILNETNFFNHMHNIGNLRIPYDYIESRFFAPNQIINKSQVENFIDATDSIKRNNKDMALQLSKIFDAKNLQYFESIGINYNIKNKIGLLPFHIALFNNSAQNISGIEYLFEKGDSSVNSLSVKQINKGIPFIAQSQRFKEAYFILNIPFKNFTDEKKIDCSSVAFLFDILSSYNFSFSIEKNPELKVKTLQEQENLFNFLNKKMEQNSSWIKIKDKDCIYDNPFIFCLNSIFIIAENNIVKKDYLRIYLDRLLKYFVQWSDKGLNINSKDCKDGNTALHLFSSFGQGLNYINKVITIAQKKKMDFNFNSINNEGENFIQVMSQLNNANVARTIKSLLKKHIDVDWNNKDNKGQNLLYNLANNRQSANKEIISYLYHSKATNIDWFSKNNEGEHVFHCLVKKNNKISFDIVLDIFENMDKKDAQFILELQNSKGKTVEYYLKNTKYPEILIRFQKLYLSFKTNYDEKSSKKIIL